MRLGRTFTPRPGFTARRATLVSLVALGVACSSSSPSPGRDTLGAKSGPVAHFTFGGEDVPKFLDVPFPSDVYLHDGKIADPLPGLGDVVTKGAEGISHELGKLNGFSRIAMSLFYVDDLDTKDETGAPKAAKIDPASLPQDETACAADTSSVFLVDMESGARVPCRSAFHDDAFRISKTRSVLAVGPARGVVLEEGHKYAAVITSRVKDVDGKALGASSEFAEIAAGNGKGPVAEAYAKAIARAQETLGAALKSDGSKIVAIAPYTTNAMTGELFALRESLEEKPAPPLAWDAAALAPMGAVRFAAKVNGQLPAGFTASLDDWLGVTTAKLQSGADDPAADLPVRAHDAIAAIGTAVFEANNYLVTKPGGYSDIDHATFVHDASGKIIPAPDKPTTKIWVTIAVPKTPMPPGGYPTVIVQHGLNGSRAYILELANTFAAKGWIALGIDSVTFGARAALPVFQTDAHTDYESAPGATYKGPDGISDVDPKSGSRNGSGDMFGGLENIGAIRDQFRTAGIDFAQLVRVLRASPDLSPLKTGDVTPKIDPDRIAYIGDSLGAIEGVIGAAIEPNVKSFFFNVVGGGMMVELASRSPSISFNLSAAGGLFFGFVNDGFNESHPLVTLFQTIVDPGDAISYAGYLVTHPGTLKGVAIPKKSFIQTEVVYDEVVNNEANEAFTRAAGIRLATPNVGSNAGVVDPKHPETSGARVPLADVSADATGAVRDTPEPGVTAVSVQLSPATHGGNLVARTGKRGFAIPFANYKEREPFAQIEKTKQFTVPNPYVACQDAATRFFEETFAGKTPSVAGLPAPVRDYDADGATDDVDADPSNPAVK